MSNPFEEDLENVEQYETEDVGLAPEDRQYTKSNDLEWFKGEKGVSYYVACIYFWPLIISRISRARKEAKAKNETLSKEQETELAKKILTKRAEEYNVAVDQLKDHQKLDLTEAHFKRILFHYKEGMGYIVSRLGKDGDSADEVWKMLGEQKATFTTVLLLYPANRKGELDSERIAKDFRIMPWRLSQKVYNQLHGQAASLRNNKLSIADQDLLITCTNSDYQNFDKMEGKGPAIWRRSPKFQEVVLAKAYALYDKLQPFRELSTADLRIKLGVSDSGGRNDDVSIDDVTDLLNNSV